MTGQSYYSFLENSRDWREEVVMKGSTCSWACVNGLVSRMRGETRGRGGSSGLFPIPWQSRQGCVVSGQIPLPSDHGGSAAIRTTQAGVGVAVVVVCPKSKDVVPLKCNKQYISSCMGRCVWLWLFSNMEHSDMSWQINYMGFEWNRIYCVPVLKMPFCSNCFQATSHTLNLFALFEARMLLQSVPTLSDFECFCPSLLRSVTFSVQLSSEIFIIVGDSPTFMLLYQL